MLVGLWCCQNNGTVVPSPHERIREAFWMYALKQTMEIAKLQSAQTLQAAAPMPVATEPGKGTVLDVKV